MDLFVTWFLYWIFNIICPREKETITNLTSQDHYENGAAFFFSSSHLHSKSEAAPLPPVNQEYDGGPEW